MLVRIVKLQFQPSKIDDFMALFDTVKFRVNEFQGCRGMKLLRDVNEPNVVMTYSLWESSEDLENYRTSDTFGEIWPTIKPWFSEKPEAWSMETYFDGFANKD
jgi:heme-degrading monooxygenase HmoA